MKLGIIKRNKNLNEEKWNYFIYYIKKFIFIVIKKLKFILLLLILVYIIFKIFK